MDDLKGKQIEEGIDLDQSYTHEQFRQVSKIKRSNNNYEILGVDEYSSVDEIKNVYTNLSEKVRPNNNKAPDSDEAFKKVDDAFKSLSLTCSRIRYLCMLPDSEGVTLYQYVSSVLFILVTLILVILMGYRIVIFQGPPYLLELIKDDYKMSMKTKEYGIEFYVKSRDRFDKIYPPGTPARAHIENEIMSDYVQLVQRYCYYELAWNVLRPDFPTPICNELQTLRIHT